MTLSNYKDILAVGDTPYIYSAPIRLTRISPASMGTFIDRRNAAAGLGGHTFPALRRSHHAGPTGDIPNLPVTKHPFFDK